MSGFLYDITEGVTRGVITVSRIRFWKCIPAMPGEARDGESLGFYIIR